MGTAWEWHCMCELAFSVLFSSSVNYSVYAVLMADKYEHEMMKPVTHEAPLVTKHNTFW
jgi:hypothetical protein